MEKQIFIPLTYIGSKPSVDVPSFAHGVLIASHRLRLEYAHANGVSVEDVAVRYELEGINIVHMQAVPRVLSHAGPD